jgi:hypothetical protein
MPYSNLALDADRENGPAARSFAADAHDCIMVRIKRSYRIQVCGEERPNGELPSDPQQADRQAPTRARSYAKARLAVHHRSACSGVKALRNTSAARRQAAKLCYRFGPLTPSARSANLIVGDGMKNGFPAPNKEPAKNQKRLLDRKSPIQVRIPVPPAASHLRTRLPLPARDVPPVARILSRHRWPRSSYVRLLTR